MNQNLRVAKAIYDFSIDGTAAGDITLQQTATIPAGAIVLRLWTNETTAIAGSTDIDITLGGGGDVDLITAVDFTGDADVTTRAITAQEITAAKNVIIHNDGSAISAGVLEIYIEYILG